MQIKGKARKYCKAGRGAQYVFRSVENIGQEYGRVDGRQNEGFPYHAVPRLVCERTR